MHLNTSPTCFKGPGGRNIGFKDLGSENTAKVLLNFVCRLYA